MKKVIIAIVSIIVILSICFVIIFSKNKNNNELNENTENRNYVLDELTEESISNGLDEVDSYYYWEFINGNFTKLKENATREEREKIYKFHIDEKSALLELCKKNADRSLIPCDMEQFDFNVKDGLLGNFEYDSIKDISGNSNVSASFIRVSAIKGDIERIYRISYSWSDGTFIKIYVDLEEEKDLSTNKIDKKDKKIFDDNNTKANFEELCLDGEKEIMYPQEEWGGTYYGENIAVTKSFREKYPIFLDLFIHYSPLEYNKVTLTDLDIENQTATFEVDSILECKKRIYEVKYLLDANKYLDDVEINLLKETNGDFGKAEKQSAYYIFKNSDWSRLPISDSFKSKFNSINGVFYPLEIKSYNIDYTMKDNEYIYIYEFILNNNEKVFFSSIEKFDSKNNIIDVINEKLSYDSSMTLEEVMDAYIRDYVENK